MDYQITQYQDQPIFIVSNSGRPSLDISVKQIAELATILDHQPQPIYLIIDNTQLEFNFADMVTIFRVMLKGGEGSPNDKRIKQAVFISQNKLMQTIRDMIYNTTKSVFPVFSTQDEALAFLLKRVELDNTPVLQQP